MPEKVIRTTRSTCGQCLKEVDATIVLRDGRVLIAKECSEHGPQETLLSTDPDDYLSRYEKYEKLVARNRADAKPLRSYHLHMTDSCNLNCPICYTSTVGAREVVPSKQLKCVIESFEGVRLNLFGGEPTTHPELFEIVRMIRNAGNTPVLYTNGIRLTDAKYTRALRSAGVGEVHIGFDGFRESTYRQLRGCDLLDKKLKAIDSAVDAGFTVILEATVVKGLNDDELGDMLRFAVSRRGVSAQVFRVLALVNQNTEPSQRLVTSEIVSALEEQTGGAFDSGSFADFQHILYHYTSIFGITRYGCFDNRYYLLKRETDGHFKGIGELLDLSSLREVFEQTDGLPAPRLAKIARLAAAAPAHLRSIDSLKLAHAALGNLVMERFSSVHKPVERDSAFFILEIASSCDQDNFDRTIVENCPSGIYYRGELYDSLGMAYMCNRMKDASCPDHEGFCRECRVEIGG